MIDFKPSQVFLDVIPPFVGTYGSSEAEAAAAMIVLACRVADTWGTLTSDEIGRNFVKSADAGVEPAKSLAFNPFFRPNVTRLEAAGAVTVEHIDAKNFTVQFTEAGLEKLRKWVR